MNDNRQFLQHKYTIGATTAFIYLFDNTNKKREFLNKIAKIHVCM